MEKQTPITSQSVDFPRWYQDVIAKAELADNGPVRGTMVIRPYAYRLWELIQQAMDERFKLLGSQNAYFPVFIPDSFLKKEAEHVEGFSPELAVVTHGGGKELEEPVVVRPTSETIINHYFAKWIHSHRDLPLIVNQWCNVVRWEMRPRLFLRTTEFLWQEGHTAHATEQDAQKYALNIFENAYQYVMNQFMAIPIIAGRKTEDEKFAGATRTWTCEAMMRDGKALQMGTSHELGQNFAKAFGTQYASTDGGLEYVWQTSWGSSTRMIGGLIMTHGDDKGMRIPPKIAPYQVVVMVVRDGDKVADTAVELVEKLVQLGVRVHKDDAVDQSFGRRVTDWEIKGVPVRVELGPREVKDGLATVVRRDTGEKITMSIADISTSIDRLLMDIQESMYAEAKQRTDDRTVECSDTDEVLNATATGFAKIEYSKVKDKLDSEEFKQASISARCLQRKDGGIVYDEDMDDAIVYLSRSY